MNPIEYSTNSSAVLQPADDFSSLTNTVNVPQPHFDTVSRTEHDPQSNDSIAGIAENVVTITDDPAMNMAPEKLQNTETDAAVVPGGGVSTSAAIKLNHCLETLSKQIGNLPNNTIRGRTMFEMYNMTAASESAADAADAEARNSVLEAILEIEFCNTPLRQQIIDSLIACGDQSFNQPLKYEDFCRIESNAKLHQLELDRLEELRSACQMLRNPYKHVVHKTNQLVDAVKVTEAAIRRLIKMSKRLTAFNRLEQNDQIALLKGSIIEMMCIRATTNFNSENNFWYFIDDNAQGLTMVSMEVLKNANWINFMSHKNFAVKFNSKFKNDPMIADLLTAIILFRPSRASTTNQEIIRDEFLNYCYLLKRYLYVNSDGDKCEAKAKYICLMHRLEELYYLAEDIVRIYLDMDPCNATPLLCELFDLK